MRDCTRWRRDSRDLAGEDGADVPRDPPRRFSDRSPPVFAAAATDADGAGGGPEGPLMLPPVATSK